MTKNFLNQVLLHENSQVGSDISIWLSGWGGLGLKNALNKPNQIIDQIKKSGLRGLGGSGFPAHIKWKAVSDQTSKKKYLICNGNEDEPGTYKDKCLMKESPLQVIEGASIAALACGIDNIIFYINPHYRECIEEMDKALEQWVNSEILLSLLNRNPNINYKIINSSGLYIGGEETAAIEGIEGKFPFPRGKPPHPTQKGLHGYPTLVSNIETLSYVSHIFRNGVDWFQQLGVGKSAGTKLFCLSGDVNEPGIYELPMGTPLSELIYTYGMGMKSREKLKAIFAGGPSHSLLTPNDIDIELDFDHFSRRQASLGTGAMIVLSEHSSLVEKVKEHVDFFADASCGQCPSCKTGTYYMSQLLTKICEKSAAREDLEELVNLCQILPGSGRCHLIDGAVKVTSSSIKLFKNDFINLLLPD